MVISVSGRLYISNIVKNPLYFDLLMMSKTIFDKIINANIIYSNKIQLLKTASRFKLLDDRYLNMKYELSDKNNITYITPVITYDSLDIII